MITRKKLFRYSVTGSLPDNPLKTHSPTLKVGLKTFFTFKGDPV